LAIRCKPHCKWGMGIAWSGIPNTGDQEEFSTRFEADGMEFEEPSEHLFSFNNPLGACPTCEGYGKVMGIDEDLVIPNKQTFGL
jgi:excinuclease UvrABC ATPase subunit